MGKLWKKICLCFFAARLYYRGQIVSRARPGEMGTNFVIGAHFLFANDSKDKIKMKTWQYHIQVKDLFYQYYCHDITLVQLARDIGLHLEELINKNIITGEEKVRRLDNIITGFSLAHPSSFTEEDFDDALASLYDWGDDFEERIEVPMNPQDDAEWTARGWHDN